VRVVVLLQGEARCLEQIFAEDLKYSKPITYDEWKSRSIYQRLIEFFALPLKEQL